MATIKSYTDLQQSKKLAEFLPLESADCYWEDDISVNFGHGWHPRHIPCWSLSALLKLIPNFNMFKRTIECRIETTNHLIDKACEPIDAAFEMIIRLHELNLL